MKAKKTVLSPKAYDAYRLMADSEYKSRAENLANISEYGFAALCFWNQVEVHLKLVRYGDRVVDGWPDRLDFVGLKWKIIKEVEALAPEDYSRVLANHPQSLRKKRDLIAHQSCKITKEEYFGFRSSSLQILRCLADKVIPKEKVLDKKKKINSRGAR